MGHENLSLCCCFSTLVDRHQKSGTATVVTPTRSQVTHADMVHASGIQLQDGHTHFTAAEIAAGTSTHAIDSNSISTCYLAFRAVVSPTFVYQPPDEHGALIFNHRFNTSTTPTRFSIHTLSCQKQHRNQMQGLLQISTMLTNPNRDTRIRFAHSLRQVAYGYGTDRSAWGAHSVLNGQESHLPSPERMDYDNRFGLTQCRGRTLSPSSALCPQRRSSPARRASLLLACLTTSLTC